MDSWIRIPAPIESEEDRRALCAILAAAGLSVRLVRERRNGKPNAPYVRFIEYMK